MTTEAPSSAKRFTIALPKPDPDPVTIATLSRSLTLLPLMAGIRHARSRSCGVLSRKTESWQILHVLVFLRTGITKWRGRCLPLENPPPTMSKLIEGRAVMAKVVIVTGGSGGLG